MEDLKSLYSKPLPSSRSGDLFSAFSYPTKISPESIAVFIASHTKPGDVILDTFGGVGTTGLAVKLCANPTTEVKEIAKKLNAQVVWGHRKAVIYELSTIGAFAAEVMCNPPKSKEFIEAANQLIDSGESSVGEVYATVDPQNKKGKIRYTIWSDVFKCGKCGKEIVFGDAAVSKAPLAISSTFKCPNCGFVSEYGKNKPVYEQIHDPVLNKNIEKRKRIPWRIYGKTNNDRWSRKATKKDKQIVELVSKRILPDCIPVVEIPWGDLYRSGYHKGISHAHHFYSPRNLFVMGSIWEKISSFPREIQNALKLLVISYNTTHSTLMTRVVVKSGQKDLVITGAQPGVLYISNLPVEKNIFDGLRRKTKTIAKAFEIINNCGGEVKVVNKSSTKMDLRDKSIDYVFTDPPFGDFIPYAEINFLNEAWLGNVTNNEEEIVISASNKKTVDNYGQLMGKVFKEIARTLKDKGNATVVFHSSNSEVWNVFQKAYVDAGFNVELSTVLNKSQGSFKQVVAGESVKGDPLILLSKNAALQTGLIKGYEIDDFCKELLRKSKLSKDNDEQTLERLYSRFILNCLKNNMKVPISAHGFYEKVQTLLEA